jgi:hypothetical protein
LDAIQIAAAIEVEAGVFITNDTNLKHVREIRILLLKDYL